MPKMIIRNPETIFEATPPKNLHHYSSTYGILGIVESEEIWSSNINSLNDTKEVEHAVDVIKHCMKNRLFALVDVEHRGNSHLQEHVNELIRPLDAISRKQKGHTVCSFSEDGDILSQWRAYGADGAGLSIGFNYNLLKLDFESHGFRVGKCIYDYDEHYRIAGKFISQLF